MKSASSLSAAKTAPDAQGGRVAPARPRTWGLVPAQLACLFLTGCGLLEWKDKALQVLVNHIPTELEESLGDRALPTVLPPSEAIRDPELQRRLEGLLRPLIERNDLKEPRIRIHISQNPALNAIAIPGGHLVFYAGMLKAAESPEEILGVAAHEVAHATERHVLKSMIQGLGLAAIVTYFLGDVSGLAAFVLEQSRALLQNGFSRVQEAEADRIGFDYLVKAGIDPRGMSRFFKRLQARRAELEQEQEGRERGLARIEAFFSTHPVTTDRIQLVEQRYGELSAEQRTRLRPVTFDLKGFQARLAEQVAR